MYLQFATQLALSTGRLVRECARDGFCVHHKGPRDIVTDVDLVSEEAIVEAIRNRYPDHDILTEESPPDQRTSRYCWVIDPLDGTTNFVHRYPCYAISIALTYDDEPIAGVVYDPMREDLFTAEKNKGATYNGQFVHVSQVEQFADAIVGIGWGSARARTEGVIRRLSIGDGAIRICGSAALGLCYVGVGWWDAYFHLQLDPWDAAAASVIIREAGGRVTDASGQPWRLGMAQCLASNEQLHARLCTCVNGESCPLTDHQLDILRNAPLGNKEIGKLFRISPQTVKNLYTIIGLRISAHAGRSVLGRTSQLVYAVKQGWIDLDDVECWEAKCTIEEEE